ncbi:hypothetical protein [Cellulophaga tyrosinoxydans]|uniref:Uncharacterized protein n=1 Tax=Cellulophaga tyrosinoxydans TaxID=504486 RepID=A0A1W2CQK3_9FLAO|nr:hypothetical protein [Cellulophaga tyrosinoxydans]SMC87234.1 hypothetical protein SAMN05660703_3149 [Cellulophaga tyrosinoxydans]
MATKTRKIGFYYLTLASGDTTVENALNETLDYINSLSKVDRNRTIKNPKFGFLDNINSNAQNTKHKIIFKSASHSFRPPLVHRDTIAERESPKTMEEGETQKTHLITKAINGDIIIILEKHLAGMTIQQIKSYLNYFASFLEAETQIRFDFETIAKDNFLEEIESLSRVVSADVYVDKQLLGSEVLDYSERTSTVKHEVVVSVKAKNRDSISDFARDVYAKLNSGQNSIQRLRVVGRNNENNIVKINTDFIERQEYVNPTVNQVTGEIRTSDLFNEMESVLQNFN